MLHRRLQLIRKRICSANLYACLYIHEAHSFIAHFSHGQYSLGIHSDSVRAAFFEFPLLTPHVIPN